MPPPGSRLHLQALCPVLFSLAHMAVWLHLRLRQGLRAGFVQALLNGLQPSALCDQHHAGPGADQ